MWLIKANSVTRKRYWIKRFGPESVAVDKVLNAFEKVTRSPGSIWHAWLTAFDAASTPFLLAPRCHPGTRPAVDKSVIESRGGRTMRVIRGAARWLQTLPLGDSEEAHLHPFGGRADLSWEGTGGAWSGVGGVKSVFHFTCCPYS